MAIGIIYYLSIEDRIRDEKGNVVQRAVIARASGNLPAEWTYNPKAKPQKPFNSEDTEFDTSFSIIHPFRDAAKTIAEHYAQNGDASAPKVKYNTSINDAQKTLFENILAQEYDAVKKQENKGSIPPASYPLD